MYLMCFRDLCPPCLVDEDRRSETSCTVSMSVPSKSMCSVCVDVGLEESGQATKVAGRGINYSGVSVFTQLQTWCKKHPH